MRVVLISLLLLAFACSSAPAAPPLRPFAKASQLPVADRWQLAWIGLDGRLVVHDTRGDSRRSFAAPECPRVQLRSLRSGVVALQCEDRTIRLVSAANGRPLGGAGLDRINAEQRACPRCQFSLGTVGRHWLDVRLDWVERHVNWRDGAEKGPATARTQAHDHDDPRLHVRTCRGLPRMVDGVAPDLRLGSWRQEGGWVVRENGEHELGRCGSSRIVKRLPWCLVEAHALPHVVGCHRMTMPTPGSLDLLGVIDVYTVPRLRRTTWDFRALDGGPSAITPRWLIAATGPGPYALQRARIPR